MQILLSANCTASNKDLGTRVQVGVVSTDGPRDEDLNLSILPQSSGCDHVHCKLRVWVTVPAHPLSPVSLSTLHGLAKLLRMPAVVL